MSPESWERVWWVCVAEPPRGGHRGWKSKVVVLQVGWGTGLKNQHCMLKKFGIFALG